MPESQRGCLSPAVLPCLAQRPAPAPCPKMVPNQDAWENKHKVFRNPTEIPILRGGEAETHTQREAAREPEPRPDSLLLRN